MSDTTVSETDSAFVGRDRSDPTAELRVKARRRLIGAAVLLLAVVVIVPAVLDPTPRALPDSIPIEIPGEKTPFTPRLSLPPLPEPAPDVAPLPIPSATAPASSTPQAKAEGAAASAADQSVEPKPAEPKVVEAKVPEAKPTGPKPVEAKVADRPKDTEVKAKFVLQAAAPASETAAKELAERIHGAGLKSFVSKVEAKDGVRYRVRVGPYATRDEAERARARLRAAGINANLVAL